MFFEDYRPQELEPQILQFWKKNKILDKLRKKNRNGKKWSFLQGPPYTSGRVHLGTAWNTALKDFALRYKRSRGFNVWDRNGYDVHGLPTAHKVMEKYKLKTKEDIEKFGVDKFTKECKSFSLEMAEQMTKDFLRIGCTLDYSDSYMALNNDYMEGEWWMIKKAWENDRLYLGEKVMTWCQNCETAVAKHECEYKTVTENSIFVKFPVKGKKDEYLIIWTTTPWTIPFNLAVMAGPDIDYVKAEVGKEKWILAKALAGMVISSIADRQLKVVEEFKGQQLEQLKYVHPFEKILPIYASLKKDFPNVHTVILSEQYVDTTAGSGLVHCAPGCGPEDQEACKPYHIPPFNNLTEQGYFPSGMGSFSGLRAKTKDKDFVDALKTAGSLIAETNVEHEYPHCWRCHKPIIFRITKQWFFKIEDLRDTMVKENKKVYWVPPTAAFDAWTTHLRDNSISRQNYWGTPLPIWKCDGCEKVEVIGSIAELKRKAGKVPQDLHKPWIDQVTWKCKCGKTMKRVPDIVDVWIDAGTAAWNCFYYPQKEKYFKEYFPADLILEATEQVRLWFSMLSICTQLNMGRNSYQNVYMHGMLRGIDGEKMSKSLGNIISPDEMIDKHSADVLRYYMCQAKAGQDIKFSWEEAALKSRYLQILWNLHKFLINLSKENALNPFKIKPKHLAVEEKYILSKLNSTISQVTELFDAYKLDETIMPIEELFLELSRTYVQMIREKSVLGSKSEKEICVYTIGQVILECLKMFNIIAPFISEAIYQNLRAEFKLKEESISHYSWPLVDKKLINTSLEKQMNIAGVIMQSVLNAREKARLGVRWPVKEVVIATKNKEAKEAVEELKTIIKSQVNTKDVRVEEQLSGVLTMVKPDNAKIAPTYKSLTPPIIAKLALDSPETILGHIEKENYYEFKVEGTVVRITREMLIIEQEVPEPWAESEFKYGYVYLNTARTEDLEAEGYSRELVRQVQSLRKKAGLEKVNEIELYVKTKVNIKQFEKGVRDKVGARKIEISEFNPGKRYPETALFRIKGEEFEVWFKKV